MEVVNFTARLLYSRKIKTGTHQTGGWVGPRAGFDKRKSFPFIFSSRFILLGGKDILK
jgi:hypothetical protein